VSAGFVRRNARWLAAGFLLSFASSLGQTFYIALFAADLRAEIGLTHGGFGGLYTAATLASAAVMVWLGRFADTIPVHRLAGLVLAALAATALAMSVVHSAVTLLVVLFALRLFGQGMPGHVATTAMARWYRAERGRALAVTGLGRAAGGVVLPGSVVLAVALVGWRGSWIIAAAVTALVILPWCVLALSRAPAVSDTTGGPAFADGPGAPARDWTRVEVARDPLFYALLLGVVAPPFILTGIFFHAAHIMEVKHLSMTDYAAAFPMYAMGSVVVALCAGWAIDRWGAVRLVTFYLMPLAAGLVILSWAEAPVWLSVFMGLAGASDGTSATLVSALWAELYGTKHLGAIRSLALAAVVASTAIAPGVMGYLVDAGVAIELQILAAGLHVIAVVALFSALRAGTGRLRARAAPSRAHF
jgi:MFS family permease